jgi:hypothetical protein
VSERVRNGLRRAIFGRRGCDPRLVARYRWIGAAAFAVGLELPMLVGGLAADADRVRLLGVLSVLALAGVPGGVAVGRWIVPTGGLPAG